MGVLSVSNLRAPRPFTERHEFLLTVLADYAAIALENSRVFQATDKALAIGMDELKTINQITQTITSHLDMRDVVQLTIKQVHDSWQVHAASLWLYDEKKQTTRVLTNIGTADEDILARLEVPVGKGFVGHVIRTGKWIYTNEVDEHPLHYKVVDMETGFTTHSLLCVPLIFHDKVIGAMQLINKLNGKFDERDVERARSIGAAVAIAISNARLYEQAEARQKQLEATLEYSGSPVILIDREERLLLMNQQARGLFHVDSSALGHLATQIIKNATINQILTKETDGSTQQGTAELSAGQNWDYTLGNIPNHGGRILVLHRDGQETLVAPSATSTYANTLNDGQQIRTELQTPIKAIYHYARIIKQAGELSQTQDEALQNVVRALRGMEKIMRPADILEATPN
jgi:GAF domain-containing protein